MGSPPARGQHGTARSDHRPDCDPPPLPHMPGSLRLVTAHRRTPMAAVNRRIVLASRPHGEPNAAHVRLEEGRVPAPREGKVLLRTRWLSLDPYMRGRMSAAKSYAEPVAIGEPMTGETVAEVAASNNPDYRVGDLVAAFSGWQDYAVSSGKGLRRVDPTLAPPTTALGILGMPGMTAYTG